MKKELKYCEKCDFNPCHCDVIDWEGNIPDYPYVCRDCKAVNGMGYGDVGHNGMPVICDDMEACKVRTAKRKIIMDINNAKVNIELKKAKDEIKKIESKKKEIEKVIEEKTREIELINVKIYNNEETNDDLSNYAKSYRMVCKYDGKKFEASSKILRIKSDIKDIKDKRMF